MFDRLALAKITEHLQWSPAVGILGPRQVGKVPQSLMDKLNAAIVFKER